MLSVQDYNVIGSLPFGITRTGNLMDNKGKLPIKFLWSFIDTSNC